MRPTPSPVALRGLTGWYPEDGQLLCKLAGLLAGVIGEQHERIQALQAATIKPWKSLVIIDRKTDKPKYHIQIQVDWSTAPRTLEIYPLLLQRPFFLAVLMYHETEHLIDKRLDQYSDGRIPPKEMARLELEGVDDIRSMNVKLRQLFIDCNLWREAFQKEFDSIESDVELRMRYYTDRL